MGKQEVTVVAEAWVPAWAPGHVRATYTPLVRDLETGEIDEEQRISMDCDACKEHKDMRCASGLARNHIQSFAKAHYGCKPGGT